MSIISNIIDSDLRGFKVNDEIVVDKNVIGEFIKNSAKLTILNKNHQYDSLEKTYLNITNFGKWYVDNLNNNEESVEADLTLFDLSIKFDEDYDDNFTFPATLGEWANWIGNKVGVPLKGTFLNYDKTLKEKPYLGNKPKYRTAVKIIAKYASGWAEINEDETYSIRWFDNTTINIEDWENFKHGSITDPVNIIILSTGVTEDNIRYPEQIPTNAHELRIEDDWLAIDRYLISKSIFEQVNGFSYTAIAELTLPYGLLEFKVGQKIKTKDIELNEIESYISSHILTWDGGDWNDPNSWTSTLKMDELKETTTKYQYSNSIESRVGKTEINCDKNNKRINMLVEDVDEIEQDITTSKQTSGNPIEVNDAGEYNLESIGIDGKSYQETTKGNQLLDFLKLVKGQSSLNCSFENEKLIMSGDTAYAACQIVITDIYKSNNGKKLYFDFESISGNRLGAPVQLAIDNNGSMSWSRLVESDLTKKVVSIPSDTSNIRYVAIQFESNNTATVRNSNMTIVKPILSFNENAEYEEYTGGTPSPNPEYPSEIETVQGVSNLELDKTQYNGLVINATGSITNDSLAFIATSKCEKGKYYIVNNTSGNRCRIGFTSEEPKAGMNVSDLLLLDNDSSSEYKDIVVYSNIDGYINVYYYYGSNTSAKDNSFNDLLIGKHGRWLEQITIGKNKFDENYPVENYYYDQNGNMVAISTNFINQKYLPINNKLSFSFSQKSGNAYIRLCEYKDDNTFIKRTLINSNTTITLSNETKYVIWSVDKSSSDYFVDLQIEEEEITSYEDYKENTALIDMNKPNQANINDIQKAKNWAGATDQNKASILNIPLKPNTIYTLSGDITSNSNLTALRLVQFGAIGDLTHKGVVENTFMTTSTTHYGSIEILSNTTITEEMLKNISIRLYEGYEPYYEFAKVGDTKDEFLDGELTKRVEKIVLSSSDNWVNDGRRYGTPDYNKLMITPPNNATKAQALCNINIISATDTFEQKSGLAIHPNGSIYISNDVKALIDDGFAIVLYVILKESKTYKLKYEPLKLHKGYNYITLNDDLYPNMNIKYLTDSKMNADLLSRAEWTMESNRINSEINKKVSNTELDEVIEEQTNKIEQQITDTTNSINLSVSQKINGIQIGGTNLLKGTSTATGDVASGTAGILVDVDLYGGLKSVKTNQAWAGRYFNLKAVADRGGFKVGDNLVASVFIKSDSPVIANIRMFRATSEGELKKAYNNFQITNNWQQIWFPFVADAASLTKTNTRIEVDRGTDNNYIYWAGWKLEKATKNSDWSPAPEDKLDNSKFTKAEIVAEINNGVSNLKLYAANIVFEGLVTANGNFKILTDGSMEAKNGKFTGMINSTNGNVGGWTIGENAIYKDVTIGNIDYRVYIQTPQSQYAGESWIYSIQQKAKGSTNGYSSNFVARLDGYVSCKSLKTESVNVGESYYDNDGCLVNGQIVAMDSMWCYDTKNVIYSDDNNVISLEAFINVAKPYIEFNTSYGLYGVNIWASDKRLKRRIKDSKYNALDTLMKIKHRQFIYRKSNEKVLIGYVADELQEIDSNMVFEVGSQKIKQPSTSYIIPILSKAIQEQQEIIDKQDKRITELENQVKKLLKLVEGKKEI